jgi:two-component system, OmpR family, phosphate regulon sensor histidine kinase PhoR
LLLLALPLAVVVWAFGGFAGRRERNNADQQLVKELNAAASVYAKLSDDAHKSARGLASSLRVQRALLHNDRRAVERVERENGGALLVSGRVRKTRPQPAFLARVDVLVGRKTVGHVLVTPIDRRLVQEIADGAKQTDQLGLVLGDRLILQGRTVDLRSTPRVGEPVDLRVGTMDTRAVGVARERGSSDALVMFRPRSEISAAASSIRWRVLVVGLGLAGALLAIVYAAAPAIARSRVTRQQRDQAERVLAHLGDGVFVVDRDGVVRLWNPAAEAITGLRAATVCDRPADEAIPGWPTIAAFVPVANRPGDRDGASNAETVPVDVDGRELWLSVVAVALGDETVYAFRDATHDRRLEDLRSQFVATISHELRTPLASLHGAAMTLREHDLPAQMQDDLLEMIAEQSNRLASLVEEILVAGQLDSGSLSVVADTFDPEELVRSVVTAARSRLGEETTIDVSIPPVLPKVHGDGERTRQVLLNLLDNAIKYSPSGGRIEVALATVGDQLRFSVRDEGLGIPVGEQERIFDKFYRLDPDQRRGIGGTGLGLYICRELVRSMHGRIWVESDRGNGTTFAFELPAEPVAASRVA